MASDICVKDHSDSERGNPLGYSFRLGYTGLHISFVAPVVEHWLKREIAQWVYHEGSIRRPIVMQLDSRLLYCYHDDRCDNDSRDDVLVDVSTFDIIGAINNNDSRDDVLVDVSTFDIIGAINNKPTIQPTKKQPTKQRLV